MRAKFCSILKISMDSVEFCNIKVVKTLEMPTFMRDGSSMVFHKVWVGRLMRMEPFTTVPSDLDLKMAMVRKYLKNQIAKLKMKESHKKVHLPLESFAKKIEKKRQFDI